MRLTINEWPNRSLQLLTESCSARIIFDINPVYILNGFAIKLASLALGFTPALSS